MKIKNLLFFLLALLLVSCSKQTTVGFNRTPILRFSNGTTNWISNRYTFLEPSRIVAYPANATTAQLYNRYTLQATGQTNTGENLQLNLIFDVSDAAVLIGSYTQAYTQNRGLAQVNIFNLNSSSLAAYELSPTDTTASFRVSRQNPSERLIAGDFAMTLRNKQDTTQKIIITNGYFADINY